MARIHVNREGTDTVFYVNIAGTPTEVMRISQAGAATFPVSFKPGVYVVDPPAPATGVLIYYNSTEQTLKQIKAGGTAEIIGGGGSEVLPVETPLANGSVELAATALQKVSAYDVLGGVIVQEKWSMTASISSPRYGVGSAGSQNAGLVFGGCTTGPITNTEKFNGFVWTNTSGLNTTRQYGGWTGVQHAALYYNGKIGNGAVLSSTEKFNGFVWTYSGSTVITAVGRATAGAQNAALGFGGDTNDSGALTAATEKFNGSAWSSTGPMITARRYLGGCGVQNAALSFGGLNGSLMGQTEKFNGSVWSASIPLLVARRNLTGACGTQNTAFCISGYVGPNPTPTCEKFNGVVWSMSAPINVARWDGMGFGTQNAASAGAGSTPASVATCEKFVGTLSTRMNIWARGTGDSSISTDAVALGADAAYTVAVEVDLFEPADPSEQSALNERGRFTNLTPLEITTSLSLARMACPSIGFKNAVIVTGGINGGPLSSTEVFNGSAWSAGATLTSARALHGAVGTTLAGLTFGGQTPSLTASAAKFNGTVWTATASMITAREVHPSSGCQGAAHVWRGYNGGVLTVAEQFNGTAWSAAPIPTALASGGTGGCGTQYAALSIGGHSPATGLTEKFNGASWSAASSLNVARGNAGIAGHQGAAITMAGYIAAATNVSETYNGLVWFSSTDSLLVARHMIGGSGTARNALFAGGADAGGSALNGVERSLPIGGGLVGLTNRFYTRVK